jgi:predicted DNA binding CopG/RHH family protein
MDVEMREEYDFSDASPNPYAKRTRKPITIRLDVDTIRFFKDQAKTTGVPYQTLINLYLADCATKGRKLELTWA